MKKKKTEKPGFSWVTSTGQQKHGMIIHHKSRECEILETIKTASVTAG